MLDSGSPWIYDEVSLLAHLDRSNAIGFVKKFGPVGSRDVDASTAVNPASASNSTSRCIPKPGNYPRPTTPWIRPCHQQAAGLNESPLKLVSL